MEVPHSLCLRTDEEEVVWGWDVLVFIRVTHGRVPLVLFLYVCLSMVCRHPERMGSTIYIGFGFRMDTMFLKFELWEHAKKVVGKSLLMEQVGCALWESGEELVGGIS